MEDNQELTCPKDCNLKFTSEKQLQIHKRKHEMVLSLNKTSLNTCDETPTPTTFIRNCEEVGLFQDLRNVNPFEETFRKAAEAVRTGVPVHMEPISSIGPDDTLHTPHVFPSLDPSTLLPGGAEKVVRQEADTSLKLPASPGQHNNGDKGENGNKKESVQVLLRMPDGTLLQLSTKTLQTAQIPIDQEISQEVTPIVAPSSTVILNTQPVLDPIIPQRPDPSSLVKLRLKQALLSSNKAIPKKPPEAPAPSAPVVEKRALSREPKGAVRRASSNSEEESSEEKRKRTLERNRAAAMRCRQRRKAWVEELGRKADSMSASNQVLVSEVATLRAEVAHLKALLLLHSNCPVTLAAIGESGKERGVGLRGRPQVLNGTERRSRLSLDIQSAAALAAELPSPVIRSDQVLTSVAPPTPTDPPIIIDSTDECEIEERTPVIQVNPNAVLRPHAYS